MQRAVENLWDAIRARGNVVAGSALERVEDFELLLGLVVTTGEMTVVHNAYQ